MQSIIFLVTGIISLVLFVLIEKRASSPLLDFKIFLDRAILPANVLITLVGFSMFMVFQTIPVLVRNPEPVGFGGDAVDAATVQIPFALILLVFGPTSGFIVSKLGSIRPIIAGTVVSSIGFFGLFLFHFTQFSVAANLAILSIGLSLVSVGATNVIILSTPRQNSGISLGISSLLRIVGGAIGPALAAMYMQANQYSLTIDGATRSFPSTESYDLIFLTAALLSIISIALAVVLRKTAPKCQNQLPKERGGVGAAAEMIKQEILSWPGVSARPHQFGGIGFHVNETKEMGHLHGENLIDLPVSPQIRRSLVDSGRALPHHIYPESEWVSYWIRGKDDVQNVTALFQLQYDNLKSKS